MLHGGGLSRLRVEPPGADLRRRTTEGEVQLRAVGRRPGRRSRPGLAWNGLSPEELRTGAGVGAAALALSSTGEVVLLAVLLGAAAGEVLVGAVALMATAAVALRWGTTSLDSIGGAQTVLGPAAVVGPGLAAASMWCAGASLILVKARGFAALLFGVTAGVIVMGPAGAVDQVALRVAAAVLGGGLALGVQRLAPPAARPVALGLATGAVAMAVIA